MVIFTIFAFIFGAIIGSFLNVVSLRLNTGVGVQGRSKCMSCSKQLGWKELIPVFSYLAQGGRCKGCNSKISLQYAVVEFTTGLLFALIVLKFFPHDLAGLIQITEYLIITCLLMVIAVYDVRHKIIPNSFVYAFSIIAFAGIFIGGSSGLNGELVIHSGHLWTVLAGPILALPFALIWFISRGTWMGLGDAKLALGIGWLLGLSAGVNAIVLAFWIGAVVAVAWMLASRRKFTPRLEIPFGPFMILGMFLVLLFGFQVIDVRILASLF